MADLKEFTQNEVSRHCTADDLWLIYNGKVYNMSKYFPQHPGGTAMLRQAGQDVSNILPFVSAHGFSWKYIAGKLEELLIGKLK